MYIFLSTEDSYTNEPHNSSWNLTDFDTSFFTRVTITNITFPNLSYPVNEFNNTIVFQEDSVNTDIVATLTEGVYSASEFATELKTRLDAAGSNTYTIAYNASTYKYTVTTSGTNLRFMPETTANDLIGLDLVSTPSFAASVTSNYPIRLDGSQYVDIVCSIPSNNTASNNRPVFKRIPLTSSFGSVQFASFEIEDSQPFRSGDLSSIDIRLQDDAGNPFVLPSNAIVQYTMRLS
jgi:hypothetical protein